MKILRDYLGRAIRLTDERLAHIREHPEMHGLEHEIDGTVATPETVIESRSDHRVSLYYRRVVHPHLGRMYLCVAAKHASSGAFVATAYITDRMKQGNVLWPAN